MPILGQLCVRGYDTIQHIQTEEVVVGLLFGSVHIPTRITNTQYGLQFTPFEDVVYKCA